MFTRIGPAAYKSGLGNIIAFCDYLGHPELKYKTIHIAGTNGKGSTSHMMAAIMQQAGYRTGLYTSPHLKDFRERIRINGQTIEENDVVDFVVKHRSFIENQKASFFEVTTAMAFELFALKKVDVAVIETGLGGRLDSTNVIKPDLCLITNISWDHADLLGDSLQKIAYEKAGIIKHHTPVVISERQDALAEVFIQKAKSEDAPLYFATDAYDAIGYERSAEDAGYKYLHLLNEINIYSDLTGSYQLKNIAGVLQACNVLNEYGYIIKDEDITVALTQVRKLTGLRGRWDVLQNNPLIIADIAHNEGGLIETIDQLVKTNRDIHFVLGFVKDKDVQKILRLFPKHAKYYFCKPDLPRGLDAAVLAQMASENQLTGTVHDSVHAALIAAKNVALYEDIIYVGGSTFVVAEVV
jgi:dihydrofolate synthase/folylpolyglutamate synthase